MKITRQKHAKKHLGFFRNNFGVREPYQILLDGTFCQAALRGRIQLREQLPRYLMAETQLCTTRWAGRAAAVRAGSRGAGDVCRGGRKDPALKSWGFLSPAMEATCPARSQSHQLSFWASSPL